MAACAAGLVVALLVARPLTAQVLLDGALYAVGFPLGYATVGLVLTLRRPGNPIGWLYATSALVWSLIIPLGPWVDQLVREQRPLPLLAKLDAMAEVTIWAPAIAVLGVTVPLGDLRGAWLDPLVVLSVPVAVAVAVLRYRLWDLDRLVSRTVAYALLTLLLGLGYAAVVLRLGRLLPEDSTLVVAGATLAVAVVVDDQVSALAGELGRRFRASLPGGRRRGG
jgi:hypothetical protein